MQFVGEYVVDEVCVFLGCLVFGKCVYGKVVQIEVVGQVFIYFGMVSVVVIDFMELFGLQYYVVVFDFEFDVVVDCLDVDLFEWVLVFLFGFVGCGW